MLYRPRNLLPPDGLPSAVVPCHAARVLYASTLSRKRWATSRERDVLQDIRLGADEFVCFREIGRAAIADDFPRNPRRQWIARDARKRIGAAALQRDFDVRQGFGGAGHRIDLRQPVGDDGFALLQRVFKTAFECEEVVQDVVDGMVFLF